MKTYKLAGRKNICRLLVIAFLLIALVASVAVSGVLLFKEHKLDVIQQEALEELDELDGEYDTNKIVLSDTSYSRASALAEKFNADLRITADGKFATLTLPENVTVRDIYNQKENRGYLSELSLLPLTTRLTIHIIANRAI
jgi:hypothetical protein